MLPVSSWTSIAAFRRFAFSNCSVRFGRAGISALPVGETGMFGFGVYECSSGLSAIRFILVKCSPWDRSLTDGEGPIFDVLGKTSVRSTVGRGGEGAGGGGGVGGGVGERGMGRFSGGFVVFSDGAIMSICFFVDTGRKTGDGACKAADETG